MRSPTVEVKKNLLITALRSLYITHTKVLLFFLLKIKMTIKYYKINPFVLKTKMKIFSLPWNILLVFSIGTD
jgi:hypothetical protein